MFGHMAQMPQMLRRAGIERAVVWRGVPSVIDRNVFTWASPDGSEVEAEYLVGGYGNGAYLFDVPDRLPTKLAAHVDANESFYGRQSILAMYGTDHAVPSPRLADLVDAVNADESAVVVRMETLADYAARTDAVVPAGGLPRWTGELRSGARANMLMNVTSARVDIKIACGHAERLLERYAEPLTALHGTAWPERQLELAWRRVVDNSAHDSICGCSHDAVGRPGADPVRGGRADRSGCAVADPGRDRAVESPNGQWVAINPSPAAREDLVEFDVAVPPEWETVELRSGGRRIPSQVGGRADPVLADLKLHGSEIPELFRRRRHGRELFGRQINSIHIEPDHPDGTPLIRVIADDIADPPELDVEELLARVDAAVQARPDDAWRLIVRSDERCHIVARVAMPALGWATIEVVEGDAPDAPVSRSRTRSSPPSAASATGSSRSRSRTTAPSGCRAAASTSTAWAGSSTAASSGTATTTVRRAPTSMVERPTEVEVEAGPHGPLRSQLVVRRRFDWPVAIDARERVRSTTTVPTDVFTALELRAGEPFVRVEVHFENRSRDHRVRFHVPLAGVATGSAAEGQYAVVERGLEVEGGHGEVPLPTFPARGFVQSEGVSVLLDHIVEYEVVDGRELALTLLRSFGWISRNGNPYREDPAGPEMPVPAAHLLGERSMRFALMPHAGDWSTAGVIAMAERYQHGALTVRGRGRAADQRRRGRPGRGPGLAG